MIWDLLIKLINFAVLGLTSFDHFDTFPGGWGGCGKSRLRTISAQLKLELRAELGKINKKNKIFIIVMKISYVNGNLSL